MNQSVRQFRITIAILCKDNLEEFQRTFQSLLDFLSYGIRPHVEVLVIDGSLNTHILDYINLQRFQLAPAHVEYKNTKQLCINGIYPSMNFALDHATGQYIHFLNSGDALISSRLYEAPIKSLSLDMLPICYFAKACIIGRYFSWVLPNIKSAAINRWLCLFEPNHQAMLVDVNWSKKFNRFALDAPIGADAIWKRFSIQHGYFYIPYPVVKFYLGGQSSTYTLQRMKIKYSESWRSPIQKYLEVVKYIVFRNSLIAELLQATRNLIVNFIFNVTSIYAGK